MKDEKLLEINKKVVDVVKTIKILDKVSWPVGIEEKFFESIKKGSKANLKFKYPKIDLEAEKTELRKYLPMLSKENPLHQFVELTINSYLTAIEMIESTGTKHFEELSIHEYGRPDHLLFGSEYSHLETAKSFLGTFSQYDHPYLKENGAGVTAKEIKKYLKTESSKIFGDYTPKFKITPSIVSKAAASMSVVKLRRGASFSKYDYKQLLVHELMTHTLTSLNGSLQSSLTVLAQGAPRTTKTQEGLATFSEVITGSLDLARLERISLRVIGIDMALKGADVYDLYHFFKENGQSEKESYLSASRLLRGGFPQGGIAFTKDGVYLEGLIRVHSFFRWAFKTKNLNLVHLLFCGRLDINDIFLLKSSYEQGLIDHPVFLPYWYRNIDLLAGKMAFSLILNGINLTSVEAHYVSKFEKAL